jgi:hypothetical protein
MVPVRAKASSFVLSTRTPVAVAAYRVDAEVLEQLYYHCDFLLPE